MSDLDRDTHRDTAIQLSALGITANPAHMARYVDTVLATPGAGPAIDHYLLRICGWDPDSDPAPMPRPEDDDLPIAA